MSGQEETLTLMRQSDPAPAADAAEIGALWSIIDEEVTAGSRLPDRSGTTGRLPSGRVRPGLVLTATAVAVLALFLPLRYLGDGDGTVDHANPSTPSLTAAPATTQPSTPMPDPTVAPLGP